ncbi:MAG: UDP-3-O-(3-hydroxymyristoyl)glucosamine N-acyltransferase, partial [Planctomycetia bacterium]
VVLRAGSTVGDGAELHPHVVLYPSTSIGARTVVHSAAVVGSDGFGYRFAGGKHVKVPQIGRVSVGDDVEIGSGTTIDRATFGTTRIGDGTKIDNQVQIAHNCQIGRHNVIVAHVAMGGSCTTGDYVVIAGKVGVADHAHLGAGVKIGASSSVMGEIPAGETYLGVPARPEREAKRQIMATLHLPEMRKQIAQLFHHLGMDRHGVKLTKPSGDAADDQRKAAG